jgi:HTH-type transcriptional regulator/antitoxin HigA
MKPVKSSPPKALPEDFESLVSMHPPRAINDKAEMENVQEILDLLTSTPKLTSGQKEYLDTLTILLEACEKDRSPFPEKKLSDQNILEFLMEQHDMNASDLGRLLGDRSLGGRILKGERGLSKAHILKLCERFRVGFELFFDFNKNAPGTP